MNNLITNKNNIMKSFKFFTSLILIVFILISVFSSCNKEEKESEYWTEAYVINDGSPALDGCGIVLSISDTLYEPKTPIDSIYAIDSLPVFVKYELTGQNGGFCWAMLKQISIAEIKKR